MLPSLQLSAMIIAKLYFRSSTSGFNYIQEQLESFINSWDKLARNNESRAIINTTKKYTRE